MARVTPYEVPVKGTAQYPEPKLQGLAVSFNTFFLLLMSICLSSVAQIFLKTGLSQPTVTLALDEGGYIKIGHAIFLNIWVATGLALYFSAAIVWIFGLVKVEVSMAYPFVGLGFIVTMILGKYIMGDTITVTRVAGCLMISVGVVLVSLK